MKKDFSKNEPMKNKDQTLESMIEKDKCTKLSEDMSLSRSSISKSMRLRWKLRFEEEG